MIPPGDDPFSPEFPSDFSAQVEAFGRSWEGGAAEAEKEGEELAPKIVQNPEDLPLPKEPYRGLYPFRLLDWRIFIAIWCHFRPGSLRRDGCCIRTIAGAAWQLKPWKLCWAGRTRCCRRSVSGVSSIPTTRPRCGSQQVAVSDKQIRHFTRAKQS